MDGPGAPSDTSSRLMRTLDWYFDFISPYAYLQCARFPALPAGVVVHPKPVLLGPLLDQAGTRGPAEIAGEALGVAAPEARIADPAVKARLKSNADEAIAAGLWGVPTLVVDGRCFWGFDSGDMVLDYLADPSRFSTAEHARIASLPGIVRRRRLEP